MNQEKVIRIQPEGWTSSQTYSEHDLSGLDQLTSLNQVTFQHQTELFENSKH